MQQESLRLYCTKIRIKVRAAKSMPSTHGVLITDCSQACQRRSAELVLLTCGRCCQHIPRATGQLHNQEGPATILGELHMWV